YSLRWSNLRAAVTVHGTFKDTVAIVSTRVGKERWTQKLAIPRGWYAINALEEDESVQNWDRPSVMLWPHAYRPIIVLHVTTNEGVYETSSLAFYRWSGHRWRQLTRDLWPYAYIDRGAFCFRGTRLHVWEPWLGDGRAHQDAHRYELCVFALRHGRVVR